MHVHVCPRTPTRLESFTFVRSETANLLKINVLNTEVGAYVGADAINLFWPDF